MSRAVLALVLAAATPGTAQAAGVTCYASGQPITVTGAGFAPFAPLSIVGAAAPASATADASGTLAPTQVPAPAVRTLAPRSVEIVIREVQNPVIEARIEVGVVREPFASNAPTGGDPGRTTTWRFAGFVPGRPIYGHFRWHGRTRGDFRFGVAGGTCGTLTARARRLPVGRPAAGRWQLKLDQERRYSARTPGRVIAFALQSTGR
jgi:hypothetical protein